MRRFATYLFFFSLLLLAAGYGLKSYPLLKVTYVAVEGTQKLAAADFPVTIGQNLLAVDFGAIVNAAMTHQFIASAHAAADQYGKVTIRVTEKYPEGYIYIDDLYGVSSRGELLPSELNADNRHLPIIRGVAVKRPYPYSLLDDASVRAALEMIGVMKAAQPRLFDALSEVILEGGDMRLIFEPGSIVVRCGWGRYEEKFNRLATVLSENKNPGIDIDLRMGDLAVVKSRTINREVENGI